MITNEMLVMLNNYKQTAKTLNFIFGGICFDNKVKFIYADIDTMFSTTSVQTTSDKYGKCKALRVKFSRDIKKYTTEHGTVLCDIEEFQYLLDNPVDGKPWNMGECFEYLIHKYFGKPWKRTNGIHSIDITVNETNYQIKTHKSWLK